MGTGWRRREWLIAAACFYVPYTLLFTAFFTDVSGFGSGMWESLDYWLGQQEVQRGEQPEFYYLMFFPLYEYLALTLAGPALLFYCLRGGRASWLLTAISAAGLLVFFGADSFGGGTPIKVIGFMGLPVAALALFTGVRARMFERFLVFWLVASLVAYSSVGEKMPWLMVHTALPAIVLAGYAGGRLIEATRAVAESRRRSLARDVAVRLAALTTGVILIVLTGLTIRTGTMAAIDHGDVPREFLIYTQTSPDVRDIATRIDRLAILSGEGRNLRIQLDQSFAWPWAWYLRDYDDSYLQIDGEFDPEPGAIVIMASQNEIYAAPFANRYRPAEPFVLSAFFPEEGYRRVERRANLAEALGDFGKDLRRWKTWERWGDYFWSRDVTPRVAFEGRLYLPLEYAALDLGPAQPRSAVTDRPDIQPGADVEGRFIIGNLGCEPGEMTSPLGVETDGAGNILVVDSGNHRIQKFDASGTSLAMVGGQGTDPGQFNQPSDLALDAAGNVYVTDTWNHRIQKLGPDLAPLATWGKATRDLVNPGDDEMWGPRGIAVDPEGGILVTDSGTHRVRRFAADGTPIASFGSRGKGPGQFEEPVGIATGSDGAIYVADAGNARIQKFDKAFTFVAEFPVGAWVDRDRRNKPHVEVLPDGRLLATTGPQERILLIDQTGRTTADLDTVADVPLFFPGGIAYDAKRAFVYVTDGLAGHVRRFPFSDFALR